MVLKIIPLERCDSRRKAGGENEEEGGGGGGRGGEGEKNELLVGILSPEL